LCDPHPPLWVASHHPPKNTPPPPFFLVLGETTPPPPPLGGAPHPPPTRPFRLSFFGGVSVGWGGPIGRLGGGFYLRTFLFFGFFFWTKKTNPNPPKILGFGWDRGHKRGVTRDFYPQVCRVCLSYPLQPKFLTRLTGLGFPPFFFFFLFFSAPLGTNQSFFLGLACPNTKFLTTKKFLWLVLGDFCCFSWSPPPGGEPFWWGKWGGTSFTKKKWVFWVFFRWGVFAPPWLG